MRKLQFLLVFSLMGLFVSAQTIEKTYHFDNPTINKIQDYSQIQFQGCMQTAVAGEPCLPYQSVSLLLPMGAEATSIEVELSDFEELKGELQLFPYQPARPYSKPERTKFMKNEELYASKSIYPSVNHGIVTTNYMNGYAFAFASFTPVQYVPSTGKIMYAKTATVRVNTASAKEDHSSMLWNTPAVQNKVLSMAQNPEAIVSYKSGGKEVSNHDLLIITGTEYVAGFEEYMGFYDSIGIRTEIVTVNEIYEAMTGRDNQEKIRNYIIQDYQLNGISMVLLGGDVNIVPYRGFYCTVNSSSSYEDDNIPADLYFCALDGTWNDNNNNKWGEIGEDDLLPDIGIARMSFNNANKQINMINKTLRYQRHPVLGEFRDVTMGGEFLYDDPLTYGSDYLELLIGERDDNGYTTIGIPEDYNFTRLYDEEGNWSPNRLKETINAGTQYVHHVGHANTNTVAGWYNSDITDNNFSGANGIDHNYTFFHSHGCICGSFEDDCIMERMVSIQNFAVCAIGNSRYGWFNEGQTEGPAAHLHREMTDAYYHERIPFIGMALSEGKCQTAPFITAPGQWEDGALRWNFYDLNILGDVAVSPWLDEPFIPEVNYEEQLVVGTTSTDVVVNDADGNGQKGFRCSIYLEDSLVGFGMTDEEGLAEVEFEGGLANVGDMKLIVTGLNAYPQILDMTAVPNNSAYVVYDSYVLNDEDGQMDYNESLTIDVTMKNIGNANASNVTATLTCDKPDYVTITDSTVNVGNVNANSSVTLENAFSFTISDDVPNNTSVKFFIKSTDGTDTWSSKFSAKIYAPEFEIVNAVLDDSEGNGNGVVDPGETVTIHFTVENTGNSKVDNGTFAVYCSVPEITFDQNEFPFENLEAGQDFNADFVFTIDENVEEGVAYELILAAYSGAYITYDSYVFAIGNIIEDFETGDLTKFDWQTAGYGTWSVVTENPYEGQYCAKSGVTADYTSTSLLIEIEVFSDTEISFYRKVSSEAGFDKLSFSIDGNELKNWSGEVQWGLETYGITPGTHTFQWTYSKDVYVSSGQDCAWLDYITFPPTTIITDVKTFTEENVAVYPNPNNGVFSIELDDNQSDVTIYNSIGQMIYKLDAVSNKVNVDLSGIESGLYFINVRNANVNVTKKIVVE